MVTYLPILCQEKKEKLKKGRDGEKKVGSCILSSGSDDLAEAQSPAVVLAAISSPDHSLPQERDL